MKLVVAIIQPNRLDAVKEALARVEVFRMTVLEAQGFGRQKGGTTQFRGGDLTTHFTRKIEIQIAVNDDFLERTLEAIMSAGRSGVKGRVGDGKIFVLPIDQCIRIRTGETQEAAI